MRSVGRFARLFLLVILASLVPAMDARAQGTDPAVDLSRWRGQVVLLDFWASWCGPCRQSFPWMAGMRAKYGERGLVVVAVNLDQDAKSADKFLSGVRQDFVHVRDPDGELARAYAVNVMPSSILFDRAGRPVYRHEGFHPDKSREYERHIVQLLENRGPEAALAVVPVASRGLGVRPWERGLLADPAMRLVSDPLEIELDDHMYFSKEASSGGRGFGGGGCGCN
jgi:thiol-disulfide isomerase/thioredoxin